MTLKQLEYFSAAAEAGSLSGAARMLHVAQPPVSRQIALLEEELGVQLFARSNRGIELTEAGRCLCSQAKHTFQDLQNIARQVRDVDAGLRGQLSAGVIYSDIPLFLSLLKKFRALCPQVELFVRQGTPADLLSELEKGNLHVLFLRNREQGITGFRQQILGEDPLELVVRRDMDPAPDCAAVPVESLRGLPMCLLRGDDMWGYSDALIAACQQAGFSPTIYAHCYDTPMALQMVYSGLGAGFLPRSIVTNQPAGPLCSKPVQGVQAVSYPTMVWSDALYQPACLQRFLNMVLAPGAGNPA